MFRISKFATLAGVAAFFVMCLAPSTSQATSLSAVCLVAPGAIDCPAAPQTIAGITQGVNFTLNLFIDDAVDIGEVLVDGINWPGAALSLVSIVDGGFMGPCTTAPCFQYDNTVPGQVSFITFADLGAVHSVTGSGSLAVLTFRPLVSGTADIKFFGSVLALNSTTFETIETAGRGTAVTVAAAVPEPATLILLGSGIACVVARRRRATRTS